MAMLDLKGIVECPVAFACKRIEHLTFFSIKQAL
jgi:hypothetical protein